jgi:hypothetical protein
MTSTLTSSRDDAPRDRSAAPLRLRASRAVVTAYGLCVALVAIAVARAASAPVPLDAPPATEEARREAFEEIVADEPSMRIEAAHAFPGDAWSQDDDFHQRQQKRARQVAASRGMRLGDVLRALDDGLREGWPAASRVGMDPGVAPCRPRLSY